MPLRTTCMNAPIFAVAIAVALNPVVQVRGAEAVREFATKYAKAKTEAKRRSVCIAAIDAGLIYDGAPVADLRTIFGDDFRDQGAASGADKLAIVNFIRPKASSDHRVSEVSTGWYLSLVYRPDG